MLVAFALSLGLVPVASAASSPAQIHRDAADGSIDGTYTLAELRAANRAVGTEQREYYGWEDVYREHLRELAAPRNASGGVVARSRSRSENFSSNTDARDDRPNDDVADSHSSSDVYDRGSSSRDTPDDHRTETTSKLEPAAVDEFDDDRRVASAGSSTPWVLLAVPALVLLAGAIGGIRTIRRRRRLRSLAD